MGNPVVHFEIGVTDLASAKDFYGQLFGWVAMAEPGGPAALVDTRSDEGIGGNLMVTPEGVPPYVTVYVQAVDLEATLDLAETLGGKTLVPPSDIPGVGAFATFADPDGNPIGLFCPAA